MPQGLTSRLNFTSLSEVHTGGYQCVAYNDAGEESSTTVDIEIEGKKVINSFIICFIRRLVSLTCIPSYERVSVILFVCILHWNSHTHLVLLTTNPLISSLSNLVGPKVELPLCKSYGGVICIQAVTEGRDHQLECSALGKPELKFSWNVDGKRV